ncbi:MAG: sensor histidine kinase [Steroidobacteraceae bacterium]
MILPWRIATLALLGLCAALAAAADAPPARVLIIHSFGRNVAPYDLIAASIRRDVASKAARPVVFLEATLDAGRPVSTREEQAFVDYLRVRYSEPPLDLIVTTGAAAAKFVLQYRDELFPGVPVVIAAIDVRVTPPVSRLRPGDAAIPTRLDPIRFYDNILRLQPDTRTIALVLGDSPLEHYWHKVFEAASAPYADRVRFEWYDGLSLEQMKQRIAALPANSAVIYGIVMVDGAGIPFERLAALDELLEDSHVAIYSVFGSEIGRGVVGGPYLPEPASGAMAAEVALERLTSRERPPPFVHEIAMATPIYDWRALQRWRIPESRLPPGSEVRYRAPSLWAEHGTGIVTALAVMLAQALLIAGLLFQRARRRSAEREARMLGGRLISAYEDEGRRLARELHDDVTQRLAGLSMEAATLSRHADLQARTTAELAISRELSGLSREVHAMSYRLHPSVIDDLGLEEALRVECARLAARGEVKVEFGAEPGIEAIRGPAALCLFRVAQEALGNAARHAKAGRIEVRVWPEGGGAGLSIVDDGVGFEPTGPRERASLGLASMRERVMLLNGRYTLESRRGKGTRVTAWVPSGDAT